MKEGFSMGSSTRGGLLKGLGRAMSGKSIFLTTYTSSHGHAEIAFSSSSPGKILPVTLHNGKTLIVQKNTFPAAEDGVNLQAYFRKKLDTGFFGGEGFALQELTGSGTTFFEIDGDIIEKTLAPNKALQVDQGYIAGFEESVRFDITTVKGSKNKFFSDEGMSLATLSGPGKIWLQAMPFSVLTDRVISLIPENWPNTFSYAAQKCMRGCFYQTVVDIQISCSMNDGNNEINGFYRFEKDMRISELS